MNKKGKVGRPEVYTDKQLKKILLEYVVKNSGKKINPLQLEKETGIKRHVWSRRMGQEITNLKSPLETDFKGRDGSLPLPNVIELVETYWNNKNKLIESLLHVNELIQSSHEQGLQYHNKNKEFQDLEKRHSLILEENKRLKDKVMFFETKYLEVSVQGTYKSIQKDKELKNVIDLKNDQLDQQALSTDFRKTYKSLFD